jgi:hypothetical protein
MIILCKSSNQLVKVIKPKTLLTRAALKKELHILKDWKMYLWQRSFNVLLMFYFNVICQHCLN